MKSLSRKNKQEKKKDGVFTPETFGVVLILFATLSLVCLLTKNLVFGVPGEAINHFLLGLFGYFAYPTCAFGVIYGGKLLGGKKRSVSKKRKFALTFFTLMLAIFVHTLTMADFVNETYGGYLSASYNRLGDVGFACSGGGVVTGLVAFIFPRLLSNVGTYVVVSAGLLFSAYLVYVEFFAKSSKKTKKQEKVSVQTEIPKVEEQSTVQPVAQAVSVAPTQTVALSGESPKQNRTLFVPDPTSFAFKTKRDIKNEVKTEVKGEYTDNGLFVADKTTTYSKMYGEDMQSKLNYVKTPPKIELSRTSYDYKPNKVEDVESKIESSSTYGTFVSSAVPKTIEEKENSTESIIPMFEHDESKIEEDSAKSHAQEFMDRYAEVEEFATPEEVQEESERFMPYVTEEELEEANSTAYGEESEDIEQVEEDFETEEYYNDEIEEEELDQPAPSRVTDREVRNIFNVEQDFNEDISEPEIEPEPEIKVRRRESTRSLGIEPVEVKETKPVEVEKPKEIPPINREYFKPPIDLLKDFTPPVDAPKEDHDRRISVIKQTLEDFKICVEPHGFVQGPSVTRYEVKMPVGVPVKRISQYSEDLQMYLETKQGVRIEAPIPGKNLVGIEVANDTRVTVGLKEVILGMQGEKFKPSSLIFALGKDIVGKSKYDDLAKGPHFLVAGSSGSGKSVCLNVMLVSLIMRYSPEDLRLILIDPKYVEFKKYEHLPHLLSDEIITKHEKVLAALDWAINEMERRYEMFAEAGSHIDGIDAYNEYIASDTVPKMPRIVIMADELADLMAQIKRDLESKLQILTQKARAAGIHLVLATQRPSANVITGVIKTNLPSRIALKVGNYQDSIIIMDGMGAEKLLGNGDMLYKNSTMPDSERYQGAYITPLEIKNIVDYVCEHNKAYFDADFTEYLERTERAPQEDDDMPMGDFDGKEMSDSNADLLIKALALGISMKSISISQIQRRFQVGYIRAAGLIDKMEDMGYVSPSEGSKARRVLITKEEYEEKFGPMDF